MPSLLSVFLSQSCVTEVSHMGGFKQPGCTVSDLEARNPKSRCPRATLPPKAPGEGRPCPFLSLGAPGVPWLVAASLQPLPPSAHRLPPSVSLPSSHEGARHAGPGAHPVPVRPRLNPITPAKARFAHRATVNRTSTYLLGDPVQPTAGEWGDWVTGHSVPREQGAWPSRPQSAVCGPSRALSCGPSGLPRGSEEMTDVPTTPRRTRKGAERWGPSPDLATD